MTFACPEKHINNYFWPYKEYQPTMNYVKCRRKTTELLNESKQRIQTLLKKEILQHRNYSFHMRYLPI